MENELFLQLGDIIRITSLKNEKYNDKIFLIKYISNDIIQIINKNNTYDLTIENNKLTDESISKIELLHRSKKNGFAEQNKLEKNTWIDIYFNGDLPMVITGIITNKEEDMIEIKLYPNNELIYIDFGYKGIDPKLNIEKIIIRKNSPIKNTEKTIIEDEDSIEETETKEEKDDLIIEENDEEYYIPNKINEVDIEEINNDVKKIILGEELGMISQSIKVNSEEERYGIEIQTNDLLNDLISKIDDVKTRKLKSKEIEKNIKRFEELRKIYSEFDGFGNPISLKKKGFLHKPLTDNFKKFKNIEWIIPIIEIKNKLYDIDTDEIEEQEDIANYEAINNMLNIMDEQNKYDNNIKEGDENNFKYRLSKIINYLKPFEEYSNDESLVVNVLNDTDCIVNNDGNYTSTVLSKDKLMPYKFKTQRVNYGNKEPLKYIENDNVKLKSIMFLPYHFIEQSKMYLSNSDIFEKSILNLNYIFKEKYLKKLDKINETFINLQNPIYEDGEEVYYKIKNKMYTAIISDTLTENYPDINYIINVKIDDVLQKIQVKSDNLQKKIDYNLENTNNFSFIGNDIDKLLDIIIPKNKDLISKINFDKNDNLTLYQICKKLEPFGIYIENLSFMFYKALISQIIKKTKLYKDDIRENNNIYLEYITSVNKFNNTPTDKYKNEQNIYNSKYKNYEFLNYILNNDQGELLNLNYIQENFNLYNASNIEEMESYLKSKLSQKQEKKNDKKCKPIIIAKEYYDIKELEEHNDKTIYFDKDKDDIVYDILDVYSKEKMEMNEDDFKPFLIEKLQEVNGLDESTAIKTAISLIEGRKKVEDDHYAIYHEMVNEGEIKLSYFKRLKNFWVLDNNINENEEYIHTVENNDCNYRDECIKTDDNCEPLDTVNKKYVKNMISKLLVAYEHVYNGKKELIENNVKQEYESKSLLFKKKMIYNEKKRLYLNTHMINIGRLNKVEIKSFEKSPHYDLFQEILGIEDYSKKQYYLINFIEKYTRTPGKNENQYMLYCIDSDSELVPTFMQTVASSFLKNMDMEEVYQKIIDEQGIVSEDGDALVDKHTCYEIRKIYFDNVETYDSKGSKINRLILEQDENTMEELNDDINDDIYINSIFDFFSKEDDEIENIENEDTKYIMTIIKKLKETMNLTISKNIIEVVIYASYNIYKSNYYVENITAVNRKKSLIILTICTFTTCLQIYNKNIKINRVIPGCNISLEGFPLYNKNDYSLLEYISCVIKKISNETTKNNPFKLYSKSDSSKIVNSLKKYIENDILNNNLIQKKINDEFISNINILDIERKYSEWKGFVPMLENFFMKIVQPLPKNFIEKITNKLKSKENVFEDVYIIKSKIMETSFGIQYLIQNIIEKEKPILKTKSNIILLENSCCSKNNNEVMLYFLEKNSNIKQYFEMINSYNAVIKNLEVIERPAIFTNAKNNEIIKNEKSESENNETTKYNLSEELIYKSFIKLCRWENNNINNTDLINICGLKNVKFEYNDTIKDKIKKIKDEKINLNENMLSELLKIIRKRTMTVLDNAKEDLVKINKMIEFLSMETNIEKHLLPIREIIMNFNNEYMKEISSGKKKDYTKVIIEATNVLEEKIKENNDSITTFLNAHLKLNKNKKVILKNVLHECILFKDNEKAFVQSNNFGLNIIKNITTIYPSVLMKNHKTNLIINKNWSLAKEHQLKIKDIINDDLIDLQEMYGKIDSNIIEVLNMILDIGPIYNELVEYLPMHYKDSKTIPFMSSELVNKILHYLIVTILNEYISLSLNISNSLEYDDTVIFQKNISEILFIFIQKINSSKSILNFDNEKLKRKVKKTKEKEKKEMTDRLKKICENDEEREAELLKKYLKLGPIWSKGLKKSNISYDANNYTEESNRIIGEENINAYLREELNENEYIGDFDSDFNEGGYNDVDN